MPLNIDLQQILLHLFNFVILAGGLYLLLYKPVRDFMDKRAAHYEQMDQEAKQKLQEAEALKNQYDEQLANVSNEIREQRAKAEEEANKRAKERMDAIEAQAQKAMQSAREEAEHEREKIMAEARMDVVKLATAAAQKIMNESLERSQSDEQ